jgi:hypothetical protein
MLDGNRMDALDGSAGEELLGEGGDAAEERVCIPIERPAVP